nr:fibroin heavy chain-like [Aegilops tauschii subsp. strangulata]
MVAERAGPLLSLALGAIVGSGAGCERGARARDRTGLTPDAARGVGAGSQNTGQWGGAIRGGRGEARYGDGAAVPELVTEAGEAGEPRQSVARRGEQVRRSVQRRARPWRGGQSPVGDAGALAVEGAPAGNAVAAGERLGEGRRWRGAARAGRRQEGVRGRGQGGRRVRASVSEAMADAVSTFGARSASVHGDGGEEVVGERPGASPGFAGSRAAVLEVGGRGRRGWSGGRPVGRRKQACEGEDGADDGELRAAVASGPSPSSRSGRRGWGGADGHRGRLRAAEDTMEAEKREGVLIIGMTPINIGAFFFHLVLHVPIYLVNVHLATVITIGISSFYLTTLP